MISENLKKALAFLERYKAHVPAQETTALTLKKGREFLQSYRASLVARESTSPLNSIRRYTIAGMLVVLFLTCGVGLWAGTMEIAGALIAPGTIVVESNIKKVQHPTGGVVGQLLVQDGAHVKAGDLLVRLDDTITRANLSIVTKTLTELMARKARLEAERDGSPLIKFPDELVQQSNTPEIGQAIAAEIRLFELRKAAQAGRKSQLEERINQAKEEIIGFAAQRAAKEKEVEFIKHELVGVRDLYEKLSCR